MNKNVNRYLIKEKNINNYVVLENLYKYLFEYYLISKVNIKKYDDELLNSNLDFGIPNPNKNQIGNDLNRYIKYNYIYLINDFFIEKLSITDINTLNNYLRIKELRPNKELLDIIDRTYKDVINNNYTSNGYINDKYKVYYGEFYPGNFVDNDALCFKIFYGKNKNKLNDSEYLKNMEDKELFLNNLIERMSKEIKDKLDINVNILVSKIGN